MPISPARKSAYEILQRVESGHAFAVDLLQREQAFRLKEADQGLATELVMGVLRWRGELDFEIEQLSARKAKSFDPEVLAILRMGIYQIRFLERVPKHAVVHDAVEMTKAVRKRSAAGLVNAVLRKCEPAGVFARSDDFDRLSAENRASVRRTFPAWLLDRWERITVTTAESGDFGAIRLAYASLRTPRTTLRVVDARLNPEDVRQELESEGVTTVRCLFAEKSGLSVTSGRVHSTRAYQEGRVVIQDEASQLVAELVSPEHGQRVLDVCAAPGMKAGQLAQMLGTGSLVACDHSAPRLSTLSRLLPPQVPATVRWCMVRLDASHELPFTAKFHRILLDAPCSGTGTLARNPENQMASSPRGYNAPRGASGHDAAEYAPSPGERRALGVRYLLA